MKLLTNELIEKIPKLYETQEDDDPVAYAKLFHPFSNFTIYIVEYDPVSKKGFGLICGHERELGYFDLNEVESVVVFGLKFERDLYFKPTKLSQLQS